MHLANPNKSEFIVSNPVWLEFKQKTTAWCGYGNHDSVPEYNRWWMGGQPEGETDPLPVGQWINKQQWQQAERWQNGWQPPTIGHPVIHSVQDCPLPALDHQRSRDNRWALHYRHHVVTEHQASAHPHTSLQFLFLKPVITDPFWHPQKQHKDWLGELLVMPLF